MFNNYIKLDNNDILIYNSFSGTKNIRRVESHNADHFLMRIKSDLSESFCEEELSQLYERGFIVAADEDEIEKIRFAYNTIANGSILSITIILTRNCNFRCRYCYETFENKNLSGDICERLIKFIRKNITRYSGLHISWFGGEPLLCLDTIEMLSKKMIAICKKTKKIFTSSITTNGYFLTNDVFARLLKCHVYKYQVTIDGTKELHDKNRVKADGLGTFEHIIENISNIRKIPSNLFSFVIRTNFSKNSMPIISQYINYLEHLLSGDQRFSLLIRTVSYLGGNDEILNQSADDFVDYKDRQIIFDTASRAVNNLPLYAHFEMLQIGMCVCYAGLHNHFVLDTDGTLRKCTCNLDDNLNVIGFLEEDGNIKYNYTLINKWIGNFTNRNECLNCSFLPVCMQKNCPATTVYNLKVGCPYEKLELNSLLRAYSKLYEIKYLFTKE